MGRFRVQLLLDDNTWSTKYHISKSSNYSSSSTELVKFKIYRTKLW